MRSIILIFTLVFNSSLILASDYGDHHCNIYVSEARKVLNSKPQFEIYVRLSKEILAGDFSRFDLALRTAATFGFITSPKLVSKNSHYNEYLFTYPASEKFKFIAFMTNGVDSLYDNNFVGKMIELSEDNHFSYRSSSCL